MKIIKNYLVLLSLIIVASCTVEDVEDRPVIEAIDEPVLAAPATGSSYLLNFENSTKLAERFVWSEANFGGDVEVTYTVEMDVAGNGFESPVTLGSVISDNNLAVNGETLNNAALSLGGEAFSPMDFEVRVKATVGDMSMFSNTTPINVTPYTTEAPRIYMVGNFLNASGYGNDWTPADAVPLAASGPGQNDYEGYVYINVENPEFKFLPTNTSFDGDYGDAGDTNGGFTEEIVQEGESNAGTPDGTGGYYLVKVDTEALTYSLQKITSWGVIGNATPTGWDSDTNMTYNPQTKLWSVTLNLTAQQSPDNGLKFRTDDKWDFNFGDTLPADGILDVNGNNISVPEDGNYTIVMDLSNPRAYTYSLNKN